MSLTYLSANELAERIHYKPETIMKKMVDCILFEGIHYVRPLGGRKKLFIWENIEKDMLAGVTSTQQIPMSRGGNCHG